MNIDEQPQVLRVSLDEVERSEAVHLAPHGVAVPMPARSLRPRNYGSVGQTEGPAAGPKIASVFFQTWVYLGCAGLIGSLLAWGITEQGFIDGEGELWGNFWMLPLIVMLMCVGFAVAESVIERSLNKALRRAALSLALGVVFGFVLDRAANEVYQFALDFCKGSGGLNVHNPAVWLARGVAWAIFGVGGGIVYGIVGRSMKKTAYGVMGGAAGAALGGAIFDPISLVTNGGAPSRAIAFGLLGLATGVSMGLVESALKDRWLYVTAGPLAGKQFILYKPYTTIGSNQSCDIYLFKDREVLSVHAALELRDSELYLDAEGEVLVSGQPVRGVTMLENGATVQIGRYGFRYQEKPR